MDHAVFQSEVKCEPLDAQHLAVKRYLHTSMASSPWVIGYAVKCDTPTQGTWRETRVGVLPLLPQQPPDVPP